MAVSRWRRPTGRGGLAGQRDVDAVGGQPRVELGRLELRARSSMSASSAWRAWLAARPTWPRCSGGRSAHAAQQVRQLGLAPEVADPQLLERRRAAGGDRRLGLGAQLGDALGEIVGAAP